MQKEIDKTGEEISELCGEMYVIDAGPFGFVHLRWYGDEEF